MLSSSLRGDGQSPTDLVMVSVRGVLPGTKGASESQKMFCIFGTRAPNLCVPIYAGHIALQEAGHSDGAQMLPFPKFQKLPTTHTPYLPWASSGAAGGCAAALAAPGLFLPVPIYNVDSTYRHPGTHIESLCACSSARDSPYCCEGSSTQRAGLCRRHR